MSTSKMTGPSSRTKNNAVSSSSPSFDAHVDDDAAAVDVNMLVKQAEALFQEAESLPVVMSSSSSGKNKNKDDSCFTEVRTKFDGDCMVSIAEAKNVNHHPNEFKEFLQNFNVAFPKINPMAQFVIPLEERSSSDARREAVKTVLKFPFPLADRIMVHWKYLQLNYQSRPNEHLLILSQQGSDDESNQSSLTKQHLTTAEREKYVLAKTFLCVYWITPVVDGKGVVRSNVRYAFSGDIGGKVPAWVQNSIGPKTAMQSIQGLINYVKERKQQQQLQ